MTLKSQISNSEIRVSERTAAKGCLGIDSGFAEDFAADGRRRLVAKKNSRVAIFAFRVSRVRLNELVFWLIVAATAAGAVWLICTL